MINQYEKTTKANDELNLNHCKVIVKDCSVDDLEPFESTITIEIEILDSPYQGLVYVENFTVFGFEAVALADRLHRDGYLEKKFE